MSAVERPWMSITNWGKRHSAVTLIAAWFNYINRVADALGVGRPGT
jgi:hypothetical protein